MWSLGSCLAASNPTNADLIPSVLQISPGFDVGPSKVYPPRGLRQPIPHQVIICDDGIQENQSARMRTAHTREKGARPRLHTLTGYCNSLGAGAKTYVLPFRPPGTKHHFRLFDVRGTCLKSDSKCAICLTDAEAKANRRSFITFARVVLDLAKLPAPFNWGASL